MLANFPPWTRFLIWDGILPLVMAGIPSIVIEILPKGHIAEVVTVVLLPIVAALFRSQVDRHQLKMACNGETPFLRQTFLGIAIALLMAFEIAVAAFTFAGDVGAAWLTGAGIFALYLLAAYLALRPAHDRQESKF